MIPRTKVDQFESAALNSRVLRLIKIAVCLKLLDWKRRQLFTFFKEIIWILWFYKTFYGHYRSENALPIFLLGN